MCCDRIKKPNFNDVWVLFKHSNFFLLRILEMHSKRTRFPWGHAPRPPVKLTPSALRRCEVFRPPPILQSFCHLLITLLKTLIYCYQNPVPAQSLMMQTQYISASKVMEYTQVGFLPDFLPVNVCQSFSFSTKWLSTFIRKLRKQHSQ